LKNSEAALVRCVTTKETRTWTIKATARPADNYVFQTLALPFRSCNTTYE